MPARVTSVAPLVLALAAALAACARPAPRVRLAALAEGVDAFVAAHPLAAGQNIRADEVGRTAGGSYHLVQVRRGEAPHRHMAHDLTVVVLRGHGSLALGAARLPLVAGDAAVVPRGETHWFTNEGRELAIALVVFTPPLDAPDQVPADGR